MRAGLRKSGNVFYLKFARNGKRERVASKIVITIFKNFMIIKFCFPGAYVCRPFAASASKDLYLCGLANKQL